MAKKSSKTTSKKTGRAKPMTPKSGVTKTHRRYEKGGKLCK
jgi:hypothetical protein